MEQILETLIYRLLNAPANVAYGDLFGIASLVSTGVAAAGSVTASIIAGKQAKEAAAEASRLENEIKNFKRQDVVNPYSGVTDISEIAKDLSSVMTNPYQNLGVATSAAEIQMEQTDIALANTLDTLRASGASAGGATALAQAALQSKKGVSASIEQQESQNEKLKAQGESEMQRAKIAEQQRIQGVQLGEGRRTQQAEVAGEEFVYRETENRQLQELNRLSTQQDQARANEAQSRQNQAAAFSAGISAVGSIGSAFASGSRDQNFKKG